jgi:hypothetical protein
MNTTHLPPVSGPGPFTVPVGPAPGQGDTPRRTGFPLDSDAEEVKVQRGYPGGM